MSYIVALRQTEGSHAGIITWSAFRDRAHFNAWMKAGENNGEEVVEEGITEARALELCMQTPPLAYARAAVAESTDPKKGRVDLALLKMHAANVAIALASTASTKS